MLFCPILEDKFTGSQISASAVFLKIVTFISLLDFYLVVIYLL